MVCLLTPFFVLFQLINAAFANETAASDTTAVEKRQTGVNDWGEFHKMSTHQDQCRASSFIGDTGPHAPTTGRCKALQDWADNNGGYFETIYGRHIWGDKKHWLIKTFPGGGNACAFWVRHAAYKARIGNLDLKDLIRDSLSKFTRNFNGVYRMRARGVADCNGDLVKGGSVAYEWWVDNE